MDVKLWVMEQNQKQDDKNSVLERAINDRFITLERDQTNTINQLAMIVSGLKTSIKIIGCSLAVMFSGFAPMFLMWLFQNFIQKGN